MRIKPISGYLFLAEEKPDEQTASGIVLPQDADVEPTSRARVCFMSDVEGAPFAVGDLVLIKRYQFDEISVDGVKYLLGKPEGIYAVLYAG